MILIVDDDSAIRSSLSFMLKHAHYEVRTAASPSEAIDIVRVERPQLVLLDMNFSLATDGKEGMTLLKQLKVFRPDTPVILMTAWGSIQLAVEGMKAGAFDFITKPWNNAVFMQRIETALELSNVPDIEPTAAVSNFDRTHIVGRSKEIQKVLDSVERIAHTDASVLITGESGTGKELIAEAIHINSRRKDCPFVKVNLGGISQSLFESEMFGYRKGAFTDAIADRAGRFEVADKGTIFLDEIGELDVMCQVKLLRVLQDQTFEPLGESKPRRVNVRVISATNEDLKQMIADHTFREDLFYRINLIQIHLPALRERREDIPLLVHYFAKRQSEATGESETEFTDAAMNYLCSLPYPGNIRELKNLIERTILMSGKKKIDVGDFEPNHQEKIAVAGKDKNDATTLDAVERDTILQTIDQCSGNLQKAARTLGISRAALYRRLEKYHIQINR